MNAATLHDARTHADAVVKEMVVATARGEPLGEGWLDALTIAGWSIDRFQAAVAVAEQRRAARETLAGIADREAAYNVDEAAWQQDNAAVESKVEKLRAECEKKCTALLEPLDDRKRELDRQRGVLRHEWIDARRTLKETVDPAHVRQTDEEVQRLRSQRARLEEAVAAYAPHVATGRAETKMFNDVARWRAELEGIDAKIQTLESRKYEV